MEEGVQKYNHKEAFCFMDYATKDGKKRYTIWNSRDGVTPFNYFINGEGVVHVDWQNDKQDPNYKIRVGDLYFRDKTKEEAENDAKRRIELFKGSKYEVESGSERYKELIVSLTEDFIRVPIVDIWK